MAVTIISEESSPIIRNFTNLRKFQLRTPRGIVCALVADENMKYPIVYDKELDVCISSATWVFHEGTGYCFGRKTTLHRVIAQHENLEGLNDKTLSVDHINWCKNDNRAVNLRMATQSEQNSNRATRRDKLPPMQTLVDCGVHQLPRYVRWDKSESKFVIEKHPVLLQEVSQGLRKKATMSGTKKEKLTVLEKYNDIMDKLAILEQRHTDQSYRSFVALREQLKEEYDEIALCVNAN